MHCLPNIRSLVIGQHVHVPCARALLPRPCVQSARLRRLLSGVGPWVCPCLGNGNNKHKPERNNLKITTTNKQTNKQTKISVLENKANLEIWPKHIEFRNLVKTHGKRTTSFVNPGSGFPGSKDNDFCILCQKRINSFFSET